MYKEFTLLDRLNTTKSPSSSSPLKLNHSGSRSNSPRPYMAYTKPTKAFLYSIDKNTRMKMAAYDTG